MSTAIEWTEETWNPVTGCDRISPGCDNCYALTMAKRLKAMGQPKYQNDGDPTTSGPGFGVSVHRAELDRPKRWAKPRTVFVDSMGDLFHDDVHERFIGSIWDTMAITPQHTYQILTKRPQRMRRLMSVWYAAGCFRRDDFCWVEPDELPLPNVWLGTSIETDRYTFRADYLRRTPAAIRFLSLEPLLGPLPSLDLTGIDWVIVGGESGPGARPTDPDWVRDIRDRCTDAGIPFFFKQWGAWLPHEPDGQPFYRSPYGDVVDGHHLPSDISDMDPTGGWWWPDSDHDTIFRKVGKARAGRTLDDRTWDQMPEVTRR